MKRMKVLFGNRRMMVLLTLAILVLAATALVASSASFTASKTNGGNIFTAGDLNLTAKNFNGVDQGVILTASNIQPGYDKKGYVEVQTTGVGGLVTLTSSESKNTPANARDLADVLHITMTEVADMTGTALAGGVTPMNCQLNAMPATYAFVTPWASGTSTRYFEIHVTWPNPGLEAQSGTDNLYRGMDTSAAFTWKVVSQ